MDEVFPGAVDAGGVASFEVTSVGQGVIADGFKVTPTFAGDGSKALSSVVLKLSKEDPDTRVANKNLCTLTARTRATWPGCSLLSA